MSVTSAHWNLEVVQYQQLATLIANMVENHLRNRSSLPAKTIEKEKDHDRQSIVATIAEDGLHLRAPVDHGPSSPLP